ncbi:MAG TPA: DUF2934 domain-containing protein [Lacunisphaera sp.]|jgi:hypothetical protein|nr:DUF2934 domain-containing protein [Lacunisphaera sp.]
MKSSALRVSSTHPNRAAARATLAPSPEEISARAYQIWEQSGRPDGHDTDHWLEAERQLRGDASEREPGHDRHEAFG